MQTNNKLNRRIARKCWAHIQKISRAANMIEVEDAINDALIDTFSLRNMGLQKIRARKLGTLSQFMNASRRKNYEAQMHASAVREYMLSLIPERFHHTKMYANL